MLRRTLARLDVSTRSMYALATGASCFAGTLCELLLAADRAYTVRCFLQPFPARCHSRRLVFQSH